MVNTYAKFRKEDTLKALAYTNRSPLFLGSGEDTFARRIRKANLCKHDTRTMEQIAPGTKLAELFIEGKQLDTVIMTMYMNTQDRVMLKVWLLSYV